MLLRKIFLVGAVVLLPVGATAAQYSEERALTAKMEIEKTYNELLSNVGEADKAEVRAAQDAWEAYRERSCAAEALLSTGPKSRTARIAKSLVIRDCRTRMAERRKSQLTNLHRMAIGYKEWRRRYPNRYGAGAESCRLANLPTDFEVITVGTRKGLKATDQQLDQSGKVTMQSDVVVNHPAKPVLLVLMASDPVIWKVSHTAKTRIAGIIVASRSKQAVLGVAKSVPLHNATLRTNRQCGIQLAFQGGVELKRADKWVRKIAGRGIDQMIVLAREGAFHVGNVEPIDPARLVSSPDYTIRDYTDLEPFPPGKRGLEQLLGKKLLRRASEEDVAAWREVAGDQSERLQRRLGGGRMYSVMDHIYVILGKVNLPNGLTGRDNAIFIVPKGKPIPGGAARRAMFLWMETGECTRGLRQRCR